MAHKLSALLAGAEADGAFTSFAAGAQLQAGELPVADPGVPAEMAMGMQQKVPRHLTQKVSREAHDQL